MIILLRQLDIGIITILKIKKKFNKKIIILLRQLDTGIITIKKKN